jgi:hypothetical protein
MLEEIGCGVAVLVCLAFLLLGVAGWVNIILTP